MEHPILSVIIPVFNKWELTRNCLISLEVCTKMPYEVIVIDNGSSDDTATHLEAFGKSLFGKSFTRIRYEENRNFAPACNAGAFVARAPLLFFLNNDTIVTEGWEYPLVNEINGNENIGGVGPLLLYEDDTIQHVGVSVRLSYQIFHIYSGLPRTHRVASKKRRVQALTGAAFMIPKVLFFELGCFNEGFRNGFEDVELCLRIGRSNKKLYCLPSSIIYHLESQTPGRNIYEVENSTLLTEVCKNFSIDVDVHTHALRDGFIPFINDCLEFSITLRDEEEAELTSLYGTASIDIVFDVYRKNYYWKYGKYLQVDAFEKAKEYDLAFDTAYMIASTFPSEKNFQKALDLCIYAKEEKNILGLKDIISSFYKFKSSPLSCKKRLNYIQAIAKRQNDSFLLQEVERVKVRMGI